jgi:hypothetical protein
MASKTKAPAEPDTPGTAVATAPVPSSTGLVTQDLADLLLQDAKDNVQKFSTDDLAIPFLRVLQGLSPEVTRGNEKYLPDGRPSMFINTVTREVFDGEEGVLVVPVAFTPSYTEWKPRATGGGFVKDWRTDPSNSARCSRDPETGKDRTPEGTEMVRAGMYYVLLVDEKNGTARQCVLSLSGTQLKKARRWNSIIKELVAKHPTTGAPFTPAMFYMSYRITSVPEKNDKGSWFGVNIVPDGPTIGLDNGEALYRTAREFCAAALSGAVRTQPIQDAVGVVIEDIPAGAAPTPQREPGDEPF